MPKTTNLTGAALFRETDLDQWEALLKEYDHKNIEVQPEKQQIKVQCIHPHHNDSSPSAFINVEFGNYHCWSCGADTVYDPIKTVQLLMETDDYAEAFLTFVEHFDLRPKKKDSEEAWVRSRQDTKFMQDVVAFSRYCLHQIYDNVDDEKECYQKAVAWLNSRKISRDDLDLFSIGILVGGDRLKSLCTTWFFQHKRPIDESVEFLNDYKMYFGKVNMPGNHGALLFPHFISPSQVGKFQIRVDFLREGKSPTKFFFVTPGDKAPEHIQRLFVDGQTGFFGLDTWGRLGARTNGFAVGATEGATDTLAASKAQIDKFGHITLPMLAVPGTGTKDLDRLVSYGIYEVRFLGDHPDEHGEEITGNYIRQSKRLDIMPFRWPDGVTFKDISKAYLTAGHEMVCDLIFNDDNYELAHEHVMRLLQQDIERDGAGPERLNKLVEERLKGIGSPAAQRAFIKATATRHEEVSEEALTFSQELDDDSMMGFFARIRRDLEEHFEFYYIQRSGTKTLLAFRNRRTDEKFLVDQHSGDCINFIMGPRGSVTRWADEVRMPSNLRFKKVGKRKYDAPPSVIKKEMRAAVQEVIADICATVDLFSDPLAGMGNGVHCVQYQGEEKILLINGDLRFLGTFYEDEKGDPKLRWESYMEEAIRTPTANDSDTSRPTTEMWTTHILTVEDLEEGNNSNMKELWEGIYKTIKSGWGFVDQIEDSLWLTALAIYSAIYDFSERTLLTVVTGEKGSGKSCLVKDMFGAKASAADTLFEVPFFQYMDFPSTTEPGIRQKFDGASGTMRRGLVLDEFENDSHRSKEKMEALFGVLRGMLSSAVSIEKGTVSGHSRRYNLRFPAILAGILEFDDKTGASESRIYRVQTAHEPGRMSPGETVRQEHPGLDGDKITRELTLGVFRYAQKARQETRRIIHKMNTESFVTRRMMVQTEGRTRVGAATVGGIMAICGMTDSQIEKNLARLLTKMQGQMAERIEQPGLKIWNDLCSMIETLPEPKEDIDVFAGVRESYNKVSFFDALTEPTLRQYIGKTNLFQAFHVYEDKYLLIDRFYLRDFLKNPEIGGWTNFVTRLQRQFKTLTPKNTRALARKHGDLKFAQASKKLICFELPAEILELWKSEENDGNNPPPSGGTTVSSGPTSTNSSSPASAIPGAPPKTSSALANGPGVPETIGYKEPTDERTGGNSGGTDSGNSGGTDAGPATS